MRSLIWERALWRKTGELKDPSEAVLVFGGRNKRKDFFYEREWKEEDLDIKVFTAWSRDQKEKIYVQDVMRKEAEMIWRVLVEGQGSVCVCGSSGKMPIGVRKALVDAIESIGKSLDPNFERERAEEELIRMEKDGRYLQETW
jgi:sulfite reductase alpha subunit-like flavoprotein